MCDKIFEVKNLYEIYAIEGGAAGLNDAFCYYFR